MIRLEPIAEAVFLQQSHQERQLDALGELHRSRRLELQRLKRTAEELDRGAAARREAIRERQREIEALRLQVQSLSLLLESRNARVGYDSDYRQRRQYYMETSQRIDPATAFAGKMPLLRASHKGVIVAPDGLRINDSRISSLLMGLANEGFICLAYAARRSDSAGAGLRDDYYEYADEAALLGWLNERKIAPTILCTWVLQAAWFDLLPSKRIWYDLCEHEDLLWGMDASARLKHYDLLKEAELVTYSDKRWSHYAAARKDAIELESGGNAAMLSALSARLEVRKHAG